MKEILLHFAKYNLWANKRIIDALLALNEEQLDREITSSFPSIRKTVYHVWGAEDIWLQRLQLVEQPVRHGIDFTGPFEEGCASWQKASEGLIQFTEKQFDGKALEHVFQYYNLQGQLIKLPVCVALTHAFNHSTFHRGQLVTMLRQVGVDKIPQTDLMLFPWK